MSRSPGTITLRPSRNVKSMHWSMRVLPCCHDNIMSVPPAQNRAVAPNRDFMSTASAAERGRR
jgi:hypothetical protein